MFSDMQVQQLHFFNWRDSFSLWECKLMVRVNSITNMAPKDWDELLYLASNTFCKYIANLCNIRAFCWLTLSHPLPARAYNELWNQLHNYYIIMTLWTSLIKFWIFSRFEGVSERGSITLSSFLRIHKCLESLEWVLRYPAIHLLYERSPSLVYSSCTYIFFSTPLSNKYVTLTSEMWS